MANRKSRNPVYWVVAIIFFIVLVAVLPGWIVKWSWLDGLGYSQIFWKIKGTQFLLFFGALIIVLGYVLTNMYYLSKNISSIYLNFAETAWEQMGDKHITTRQIRRFLYIVGALIGFGFSTSYFYKWDNWFRFIHHKSFENIDPVFGHDMGFYVFQLPFLENIQSSLIVLVFLITLITLIAYLLKGAISFKNIFRSSYQPSAKAVKHIALNIGIWFMLLAFGYFLDRYQILFDPKGVVMGAGYTDVKVLLPVLWVMTGLSLLMGVLAFSQFYKTNFAGLVKGAGILLLVSIIGQGVLPWAIESITVKPNELKKEKPYLENNIVQTRQAYGLDKFHETSYNASDSVSYDEVKENIQTIDNIRLWDPRPIIQTYRQLQEIRLYYSFPSVSINRYHTERGYEQVMLSARELNTTKLPRKSQTWVNRHLQYTHGYGVAMSPVAETNSEGSPRFLIKDLPPVSKIDLKLTRPEIYYGQKTSDFKLVNTHVKELDYPKGKDNVYTHYDGRGGVSIDNFAEKMLFSLYFSDYNLLLTKYLRSGSKIQFWRNIQPRIKKVAPFLQLKDDPYLVLDDGKLYWIQDAYTTSSNYPYSQPYDGKNSYIRNSVKVVVDAYHGDVDFYVSDQEDPVLKVYQDVFPGVFQSMKDMPGNLKQHIRYPDYLFKIQMSIYNTYHMTNPQTFYNNEDLWERPNSKYGGQTIKMESYYILSKLPGQDKLKYFLISPLTPHNRDNMIAWMATESDFPDYGQVHVYELPKSRLFLGPAQIEAKIDQNTEISRQLSLWDQRGSSVIRGNLMIIPIENSFLYVEPVFLIAQGVNIPQLKRVIVTMGNNVVMEPTIHEAINALYNKELGLSLENVMQPLFNVGNQPEPGELHKLNSLKDVWGELQEALEDQKWREFGVQMHKIDSLMNE